MKKYKIFMFFILIITVFVFNSTTVNAETIDALDCPLNLDDDCYAENVFGLDLTDWDTEKNVIKVEVNQNKKGSDGKSVVFQTKSINGESNTSYKVSYGKAVYIPVSIKNDSMEVIFETTKNVTVKAGNETKTGKVTAKVMIQKDGNHNPYTTHEDLGEGVTAPTLTKDEIDCTKYPHNFSNGYYDDNLSSFEQKFCFVKEKAIEQGKEHNYDKKGEKVTKYTLENSCKTTPEKITMLYTSNMTEAEKKKYDNQYYQNRQYYFASHEEVYKLNQHYVNRYAPGAVITGNSLKCKVKCQEAVIVEYGPPVGVKAGSCFQYKVKVTSRVSCNMSQAPEKPPTDNEVCTPAPTCFHGSSSYRQGGPSEDYDKCINECDGGKYTSKCSKKCYESVTPSNFADNDALVLKLFYSDDPQINLSGEDYINNLKK